MNGEKTESAFYEMSSRIPDDAIAEKKLELRKSGQPDLRMTFLSLVDALSHALAIWLVVYLSWDCFSHFELLAWHGPLFTLAYVLFMTEGLLIFLPHSVLTRGWGHKHLVKLHWILQLLGFICIVLGMIIIVVYKLLNNKRHFAKPHSITGLVAVILAVLVSLFGWKYHLGFKMSNLKLAHTALGVVAYGVGMAAQILGYFSNYYKKKHDVDWRVFLSVITGMLGLVAFLFASMSLYRRTMTFLRK
ncbi:Hypothetical predicted protein [Cloeon dipterum]|uniref:ascorbate ferrireductase (transmembrane) n=1 Tax=Cloeon dipterum TaxID=197152 RepID=A0A8S1CP41_9INSE|nr:Hypothetical predicted protein [Cloeon dipterum]